MYVYIDGNYVKEEDAKVSVSDRAFFFGDGVYEGMKVYNKNIFKYEAHKTRFQRSLNEIKVDHIITREIEDIYNNLMEQNNYGTEDLFFYMQISRGQATRKHSFPSKRTPVGMYAFLKPFVINEKNYIEGVNVCTLLDNRWDRCDIKCISLLANCMANEYAIQKGCEEAIFINEGELSEGSKTNVFFIIDNTVYTHPKTNKILPGITRELCIKLCRKNNIKVVEKAININDIGKIQEAFITASSGEITPVIKIDDIEINDLKVGEITKKLQSYYKDEIKYNPN
jgi:D-alanine transaminase